MHAVTSSTSNTPQTTGSKPWFILFVVSCFFFYEFMQLNIMNSIETPLMETFKLNATQFGRLAGYYADANLLFLFAAGILLDRFSTRKIVLFAMIVCTGATYAFSQATTFGTLAFCRFLTGIGGSFCFLSCIRIASRWIRPEKMALAAGLIVVLGMLGGVVAQEPLMWLRLHMGWRSALQIDALLGVVLTVLIFMALRDYPDTYQAGFDADQEALQALGFWGSIRKAFSNAQNWLAGLYTSLLNLPIALLGAAWGVSYLRDVRGLSEHQASSVTLMLFLGTLIGSPLMGWVSDSLRERRRPMIWGAVLSMGLVMVLLHAQHLSFGMLMLLFLGLGIITSCQIISYPLIAESNPLFLTSTATSIASMLILGGYAVFQPFFGWLLDLSWHGKMAHGVRVYTAQDYTQAMLIFPIAFLVGLGLAWIIKESLSKEGA